MTTPDESVRIKALIASILKSTVALGDDLDLRRDGLVDSLGFVQLLTALETRLGHPIDLSDLDPDQLTKIGPLARHIAWRRNLS